MVRFAKAAPSCRQPAIFDLSAVEFSVLTRVAAKWTDEGRTTTPNSNAEPDKPKLEIGDVVEIKDGVVGVVLARFKPSGERRNEVHYIISKTGERKAMKCGRHVP